ncbi:MAG TPA: PTS fructose transporter subunit IIA [Nitrosomonas sp.]|nr:PTS fructose transporter subunit IIA [Nitrosomonas sp.]HMY61740.1 PTS fructose transporter subunit IIA [Nitrosomonas sp.]HND36782.1 PTS fructose transporter subunit IIA [Nitrosomonas sp.]
MIGLLIISHENLGEEFVRCVTHILGERPSNLSCLAVQPNDDPSSTITQAKKLLANLDQGEGVIIITDICGATPCNIASQLMIAGKVVCLAGINLAMLLRILSYRHEPLDVVVSKALDGGKNGVMQILPELPHAS